MNPDHLDLRLARFRSRRDEYPHALATALIEAGRSGEALEVVKLGLISHVDDPALIVLEGRAWFEHGDLAQAQASLIKAARLNPRDKEPYRWLGQVLMMRGDPARAVQVLERGLKLDPDDRGLQQAKQRAERLSRVAAASSRPPAPPMPAASRADDEDTYAQKRSAGLERASLAPSQRPALGADDDDDDAPTMAAAELPREVRSFIDAERSDAARPQEPIGRLAQNYALPASESGISLEVQSADLSDVTPQLEPPGAAESPEAVLAVLKDHGVFTGDPSGAVTTWVPDAEAEHPGQRLSRSMLVAWLVAAIGAGGGYYGFNRWLDMRRVEARSLVEGAELSAREGDYPALLSAERDLVRARALDPKSSSALEELVFVHAARALEDASGELGYLQTSLHRAREQNASGALVAAGEAVVAAYEGKPEDARNQAAAAAKGVGDDARVAYLVGRLYERAGREEAEPLLARATVLDPALSLAWLAQAELARERGDAPLARSLFEKARGKDGASLRADLWLWLLDADDAEPDVLARRLDALSQRAAEGSRSERLLELAARTELALRRGDKAAARATLASAGDLAVRDPEVMYALSTRAVRADEPTIAYRAARAAMTLAPGVDRYREALVDALLLRGDGDAALSALKSDGENTPEQAFVRAKAALLADGTAALEAAKKGLAAQRALEGELAVTRSALLARVDARLGASPESLLPAARTLAQRAKDQLAPQLALAELALAAHQAKEAASAAQRGLALMDADADALTLLGRAQRMSGELAAARATLVHAVERAPARRDAQRALASLLLDSGEAAAARAIYDTLVRAHGMLRDRLSAIEAQAYEGDASGAEAQLASLDQEARDLPVARVLAARVALALGQGNGALDAITPLLPEDGDARTPEVLALYGDALFALGRVDPAAGAYDDALGLDANYPEALLGRATAALRADKLNQAEELLTRASDALSTRARPPVVRATVLLRTAQLAFARKDFNRVRDLSRDALKLPACPAEAHFWLAEALTKLKLTGASESYARYLELAPEGAYAARAKRALSPR